MEYLKTNNKELIGIVEKYNKYMSSLYNKEGEDYKEFVNLRLKLDQKILDDKTISVFMKKQMLEMIINGKV